MFSNYSQLSMLSDKKLVLSLLSSILGVTAWLIAKQLRVPKHLSHLPTVPIGPLLWSYLSGEAESDRICRLILPFANERNEGVVLVYALGRWMVHVLDCKMVKEILSNPDQFPKEEPPDGILLWRLVGYSNIILANGRQWKRHSEVVRAALGGRVPVDVFVSLSKRLFQRMGNGGTITVDELFMRFTLDAVGTTALGHDFNAIEDDKSPFVIEYGTIMESIANPLYLLFTSLEKWWPRRGLMEKIDSIRSKFDFIMKRKMEQPGNDMFSFMLEHPEMTNEECRDNMVVFFIAGHDTAAGALSSLIYYLAKHLEIQSKARKEVLALLGDNEPDFDMMQRMPFLTACIREALRLNTPITYIVPRSNARRMELRGSSTNSYLIPKGSSLVMNLTAVHLNSTFHDRPFDFFPERFLDNNLGEDTKPLSWIPFASGPRQCPARNFAIHEIRTLAAMLLVAWDWALPLSSPHTKSIINGFSPFALSLPKDLKVEFSPRSQ